MTLAPGRRETLWALALLVIFFVQVVLTMQTKSPTVDEIAHHIPSGYSHLVTGDFRMNPAAPPLPRLLSSIPLFFMGVKAPLDHISWKEGNAPIFAQEFFYAANHDVTKMVFWARVPIALLACVFGWFVFVWARELFGPIGGIAALILFVFSPDVVAHSGLATSDIAIACFFYLTIWRFWKYLRKQSLKNILLTGVFAGCAMISKFSAVLVFPALVLLATFTGSWKKLSVRSMALFLAAASLTIWAGYFFEVKPLLKNTPDPPKKIAYLQKLGGEPLVRFASDVPIPFSTFTSAFGSMMMTRAKGTNAYFMGEWSHSRKSWWCYYLTAYGVKNTIPVIILLLASLLFLRWVPADGRTKVFLLLPVALFFLVTLRDKAQAGIRYFLPIYPLIFILGSGWIAQAWKRGKALRVIASALLAWHAVEAAAIFPDALAYFNQLAGGPDRGYRILRDSNVDWGQDWKGVAELAKKENYEEVVICYHSLVDIEKIHGVKWRSFRQDEYEKPGRAVYAVGLHSIDAVLWHDRVKPDHIVGHSVWVYDLRRKDV